MIRPYHLKKGQHPYWIRTIRTMWHVCLGAIISDAGSKTEILSRIAQCTTTMTRLKPIWNDQNITLRSKVRLMRTLIISILLYACETWTLTIELQKRIKAVEMRCYRRLLHISYDHITNEIVCKKTQAAIGPYKDILTTVKKRKLRWFGHVQYQGKEEEEGKRKDGKTTSESGPVSTSTAVREQPKTVRDGRRLSPMSAVVPLRS